MSNTSIVPRHDKPAASRNRTIRLLPAGFALTLLLLVVYGGYVWLICRVVVAPGQVMVLLKKNGSHSLTGDQIIIPRPPADTSSAAFAQWKEKYADCNGVFEQVYATGVYFNLSPIDYDRLIFDVGNADVPSGKVGIVLRKFGDPLPAGQVLADPDLNQRGYLPGTLAPGKYYQFANPLAYQIELVDPVQINPGYRGVVTNMAAKPSKNPNQYLVGEGEQGVQARTESEGFRYFNPVEKRVIPITIQSQRFEMAGDEAIQFPSSDSFDIRMEGFVEWSIIPDKLPLMYVQYASGGELLPYIREKVILPYARSFCRLVGSKYTARQFISGETRLKFQAEFESRLREACEKQGVEVLQALVRDIVPPDSIKDPINEREIAKQQIHTLEQQIQVAKSAADLATQEAMAEQNQEVGDANKEVVTMTKKSERDRDVAETKAAQELSVAKLKLEAAQQEADAITARGQADANVVLLQKKAEAEPLQQQIQAFGDGQSYAQFFFYQKSAPAMKTILTNTDGPFADLFKALAPPRTPAKEASQKLTQAGTGGN